MGVYYMKHPKHGTKVATQEEEVEHDKKRGWTQYEVDEIKPEVEPVAAAKEVQKSTLTLNKSEARA